jgi:hypothetical protein
MQNWRLIAANRALFLQPEGSQGRRIRYRFTTCTTPDLAALRIAHFNDLSAISRLPPFQTSPWRKDHLESPPPCLSLEGSHARKLVPLLLSYLPELTGGNATEVIARIHDVGLLGRGIQDQESCHQDQNYPLRTL